MCGSAPCNLRGGTSVLNRREYEATPRFESRAGMLRFRRESSHTRNRTYTLAPTNRAKMIAILGRWLTAGAGVEGCDVARTTAVAADAAVAEPARFVAVTTTRSVWPTSVARKPYVLPLAPTASVQAAPVWSQRCHW
jgi:hypothetical protein